MNLAFPSLAAMPDASVGLLATAIQFAWLACVLSGVFLCWERVTRPKTARQRYRFAVIALLTIAGAPLATQAWHFPKSAPPSSGAPLDSTVEIAPVHPPSDSEFLESFSPHGNSSHLMTTDLRLRFDEATSVVVRNATTPHQEASEAISSSVLRLDEANGADTRDSIALDAAGALLPAERTRDRESNADRTIAVPGGLLYLFVAAWTAGSLALLTRLLLGAIQVRRWERRAVDAPEFLRSLVPRLKTRLNLRRTPRILVSAELSELFAAGVWTPRVFFPAGWMETAPVAALEGMLAHEMAHVRRRDLWINFLQRIVAAIWWFHPAVWWWSSKVRREREICCDAEAVAATGRPLEYAKALEFVVERKVAVQRPCGATCLGDDSMAILRRVKAVLGLSAETRQTPWWGIGALGLALPAGLWLGSVSLAPAAGDDAADVVAFADGEPGRDKKPEGERREGDRPREGERRDGERREGDRPRDGERREGDRRPEGGPPRDGERPRPPREGEAGRDGERPRPPREGDRPRPDGEPRREGGERRGPDGPPMDRDIARLIMELRQELAELRREVRELRERGPMGPRDGERRGPEGRRPDGDRRPEGGPPREGERRGPEGDRRPEGGPPRDGDRRGPEGDRRPEGAPPRDGERRGPDGRRPEGDRKPEGERRPDGERKPEGERRPDGDRKPEGERKPDGEHRP